ncbi:MAG: hypothetical protein JSS97_06480 [Actinobacteria bacterium]|nr:hypothetical protein [Actinomycetota bacterium]
MDQGSAPPGKDASYERRRSGRAWVTFYADATHTYVVIAGAGQEDGGPGSG